MARPRLGGALTLLLLVCLTELVFFVLMMCAYQEPGAMISDTIFADPGYKVALSVMLMLRLTVVFLFLFSARGPWFVPGAAGVCLAAGGWCLLVSVRAPAGHYTGVAIFCAGSLLYSLAMREAVRGSHPHLGDTQELMVRALMLATVALVITFSCMFWAGDPQAYLPEHMAYITFLLFYALFFSLHWPRDGLLARGLQQEVALPQCTPLLPM